MTVHTIKHVREHVEVFDEHNRFILSADNEDEALKELILMRVNEERMCAIC